MTKGEAISKIIISVDCAQSAAFSNFYLNIKIKDIMKKYVEKSLESLKIQNLTIEEQEKLKGGSVNGTNYTITLMQP